MGPNFAKNKTEKHKKNKKTPQNNQFWACFGVFEYLNLFCLNFTAAVKLYFAHFLQVKMIGKLKIRGMAWNQVFSPNHKVFWWKMCQ